jgi:hypothetical protein
MTPKATNWPLTAQTGEKHNGSAPMKPNTLQKSPNHSELHIFIKINIFLPILKNKHNKLRFCSENPHLFFDFEKNTHTTIDDFSQNQHLSSD